MALILAFTIGFVLGNVTPAGTIKVPQDKLKVELKVSPDHDSVDYDPIP